MKREDSVTLIQQAHETRDADRLAFLDGQKVYLEIGSGGRGYYISHLEGEGWEARYFNGARFKRLEADESDRHGDDEGLLYSSFRDALDALMDWVKANPLLAEKAMAGRSQ